MRLLAVLSVAVLAACGEAADMPVAAPGEDIVAGDAEGVAVPSPPTVQAATLSDFAKTDFTMDPPDGLGLALDMDSADARPKLEAWANVGAGSEGRYSSSVRDRYDATGHTIIVATREGLMDDSVAGEQLYLEFTPVSPLTNRLDYAGMRIKCARGANAGAWQVEPCP